MNKSHDDEFWRGYDHAIDEVVAYFRDLYFSAKKAGRADWPGMAANHVDVAFVRNRRKRAVR